MPNETTTVPPVAIPPDSNATPGGMDPSKVFDHKDNVVPGTPPASDQTPADKDKQDVQDKGSNDPKGTEGKPADEGSRVVPEKYDLKLPDGSLLNAKAKDEIASFAKEKKLTQEEAQAILERESASIASYVDSQKQELVQRQKEWVETVKADKELGGDGFNKTIEMAKRVVDRYGTDSFKKALSESGLGNHPELVRFVARIGKVMSEDQLVVPGSQSTGKKSLEDIFYPVKP